MKRKIGIVLVAFCFLSMGSIQSIDSISTSKKYFETIRPVFTGDLAYETTAFVEQFWRVAGNFGFNESVKRIVSELEKSGYVLESNAQEKDRFVYRIEERKMENPTWEPVDAFVSIEGSDENLLQFSTNRNMIYLNSYSTSKKGVKAKVISINKLEDLNSISVKGKIVHAEFSSNELFRRAILKGGAIGLITYNNPDYLQPKKNTTSIQFREIPFVKKSKAWAIALSYEANKVLKEAMSDAEVALHVNVQTKLYKSTELTVVASIKGESLPKESLVFSAHIQEPGANDNATGVGVQLEMATLAADLVRTNQIEAKRTLTFLWGDEIVSTNRYIKEKDKRSSNINWGISLDMVGENTSLTGGSFLIEKMPDPSAIWTRGNDKHTEWGGSVLQVSDMKPHYLNDFVIGVFKEQGEFANWKVNTNPYEGGSDHSPFLRGDIPALLLWHFTDQFYHTDNDRLDKVSKETLKNVGISALVSAFTLINASELTAEEILDSIFNAAETRLKNEFKLSKVEISKGSKKEKEILILETWLDWYQESMESVSDLVLESNSELNFKIKKAQQMLSDRTQVYNDYLEKQE